MKKIIILIVLLSPILIFCQNKFTVSAGIGFPNIPRLTSVLFKDNNGYSSKGNGPYHLKTEYRLHQKLALGLSVNYMDYQLSYIGDAINTNGIKVPNNITLKSWSTAINTRINYHFLNNIENDNWDFYLGLGIGYKFGKFKISSEFPEFTPTITIPKNFPLGAELTLGTRYFITENIGLYAELGVAKSILQIGLSGRF